MAQLLKRCKDQASQQGPSGKGACGRGLWRLAPGMILLDASFLHATGSG